MLSELAQELWELHPHSDQGPVLTKCPAPVTSQVFEGMSLPGTTLIDGTTFAPGIKMFMRVRLVKKDEGKFAISHDVRDYRKPNFAEVQDATTPSIPVVLGTGSNMEWHNGPYGINMSAPNIDRYNATIAELNEAAVFCAQRDRITITGDQGIGGAIGNAAVQFLAAGSGVNINKDGHGMRIYFDNVAKSPSDFLPSLLIAGVITVGTLGLLTLWLKNALLGND